MALSKQVEDSLRASQEYLRDALSFSARTEKPYVSKHIADMLAQIDNLCDIVPLCLLYTSPSPRDRQKSRMPSSA